MNLSGLIDFLLLILSPLPAPNQPTTPSRRNEGQTTGLSRERAFVLALFVVSADLPSFDISIVSFVRYSLFVIRRASTRDTSE